jgi:hypothetical protein
MDGLRQDRLILSTGSEIARKNRLTGLVLTAVALGMFAYSFLVIRHRGAEPEPANLTPRQKILRGL